MSEEVRRGKRRRWLRWTGYLALFGLSMIALGLVASLWSQARGKRLLAAEVARITADGIELDWRKLHPPTEADDTAKRVIEAKDRFDPTNLRRGFPSVGQMIGPGIFLPMSARSDWRYMDLVKGQMTTNLATWASLESAIGPYLDELIAVSDALSATPPVFQMDFGTYPESRTRHEGAALELAGWLNMNGLRHLRAGEDDQAHRSVLALLHLAGGTAGTKTSFAVVGATTVQNQAWGLLLECVGTVEWSPEQWRQVQDGFVGVDWAGAGRAGLELETAAGWHLFERIQTDPAVGTNQVFYSAPNWWNDARQGLFDKVEGASPDFAEWMDNRLEAGETWWTEQIAPSYWRNHWLPEDGIAFLRRSELAHQAVGQLPDDAALTHFARTNDWNNWMAAFDDAVEERPHVFQLSAMLGGVTAGRMFLGRFLVAQHRARLAATVCAIQRHVLAKGTPPADLAALVPEFMPTLPLDPGDGKPLRYSLNPDGTWRLYSTGLDGINDGGDGNPARGHGFYAATAKDILWPRPATPEEVAAYERSRKPTVAGDGGE